MALPTLILVSGPPGSGKTTLAHAVARAVQCPAISRDEIKEGMVHAAEAYTPSPGDALTVRAFTTFFAVLHALVGAGVTVVAEAAFRGHVWQPALEGFVGKAELRVIQCRVDAAVARQRVIRRLEENAAARRAHADAADMAQTAVGEQPPAAFEPLTLDVPTLQVDTSHGYRPGLDEIVTFARTGPA